MVYFALSHVACIAIAIVPGETWDEQLLYVADKCAASSKNGKGIVDWAWAQRAVATAEPPRLADLPSHIRFAKKWGGGDSQVFIRELVTYLNNRMPPRRVVPGNFFDKLAAVSLPPDQLVPRFVNACIKAQATCTAD